MLIFMSASKCLTSVATFSHHHIEQILKIIIDLSISNFAFSSFFRQIKDQMQYLKIIFHAHNSICSKVTYKVTIVAIHNCNKLCNLVVERLA